MKTTLTRLFTVALLMMVSLGAKAEVKVLFGEKGTELQPAKDGTITLGQKELTGGTIIISQEDEKDGTSKVTFAVTPDKNYRLEEEGLEVYAVIPTDISPTRGLEVSTTLTLKSEDFKDEALKRTYTTTIDSKLALWLKSAKFESASKGGEGEPLRGGPVEITTDANEKKLYLIQTNAFPSFFIAPQSDNTITTNNILGEYMLWYFLDAGTVDGTQYYYIVNKSTDNNSPDKYIYNHNGNSRGISIITATEFAALSDANKEKCKFKIVENNTNTGFYNINVKANQTYYGLNKQNGSQSNQYPIRLTNTQYINDTNSAWKFIPFNGTFTWPTPPFTPSDDSEKHYYEIHCIQMQTYYASTDATAEKVIFTNQASESRAWYFQEASSDTWYKYYYIINPSTGGKYMYYNGSATETGNQTDAIDVKDYDSANEERYQFVVVQAARGDGSSRVTCYAIIPKLLIDNLWTSSSLGLDAASIAIGANMGIINSRIVAQGNNVLPNGAHWDFKPTTFSTECDNPDISFDSTTGKVTISTITSWPSIYYTIDGSTPSSTNGTLYRGSFDLAEQTTVNAIVTKYGYSDSEVTTKTIYKVATPTIQDNGDHAVSITSETEGATIYYTTDGSDPTTSSTEYSGPLSENISGVTIKAIAVKDGMINSAIGSGSVTLSCATPVFTRTGNNLTISCPFPTSGVTIYYTKNGGEPTISSALYSTPISVEINDVIKAIAVATGYNNSEVATKTIYNDLTPTTDGKYLINNQNDFEIFVDMASTAEGAAYHYILKTNVDAGSPITVPFTGVFEVAADENGNFYTITGLTHPLFNTINGGVVKNAVFSEVAVKGNGTICNEANGATKIYNCGVLSGTVTGSGNVGGLVGHITSSSSVRVINCYNFAKVSGGSIMGGIVGNNEGTVGDVRIALCVMYGDMPGGTSPVYAGNHISNSRNFTEYNYYRSKANLSYSVYNDQLAIDKDEYLTRFPFYRHILNTHRELAAFFLFGESGETVNDITANEVAEIGHWVLNKDLAPYPIVEEWKTNTKRTTVDIANNLPDTTEKGVGKLLNDIGDDGYYSATGTNITKITAMGNNGYLTVNVSINGSDYSASLPITDMNEANYDYTWGKVVLPFANEFSGWTRDYSKVCTGWEITSITGGTAGTFANYNVSDRDCTAKDLYSNSDYIFAQGGNYIVPYGVTAINIKAHFANAFYLSDASYDVGYTANFDSPEPLGGNVSTSYHEQTVYTDLSTLVNALSTTTNPHDQAIVLVGNYHYNIKTLGGSILNTAKAVTIMSTDEDCNQEPDYGWYTCNTSGRLEVPPLRFDFVPNIEMGMSSRVGSSLYPGIGIWHTRGWFELTETCVSNMSQCEINSYDFTSADNGKGNNRWIANSGCFVQIVRARDGNCTKLSYIQIGGNAYVKELYPGSHTDNARQSATVPIAVTGGQVDECYMTGYKTGATLTGDMIYFWCGGGKIKKFLGAYLENPSAAGITAKVDHALIGRFFGGGTSGAARIKGDIDITINNSQVDFYCGGPEFGNMESGKRVTTHAIGTTFGEYYGAGFGGTSITYNREQQNNSLNITNNATTTYDLGFSTYYKRLTNKTDYGIGCCYKFEYIFHSNGSNGVTRFYTGYAQFDLATTGNVTNVLNYCTIKKLPGTNSPTPKESTGDFYGAGCQGKVNGTVTSTLTNCTVERNAFGGGYKAESNEVEVYTTTQPSYSVYTKETGIFSDFGEFPTPETYTWVHGDNDEVGTGDDAGKLFTSKILTELGNVTGNIELTINGGYVGGTAQGATPEVSATATTNLIPAGGCVYGGGNESKLLSNATVTLEGDAVIYGDVFGGGNKADVQGSATVNIQEKM